MEARGELQDFLIFLYATESPIGISVFGCILIQRERLANGSTYLAYRAYQ